MTPSERWIESEHHKDIIDINEVLSPDVSDGSILEWLSPTSVCPDGGYDCA